METMDKQKKLLYNNRCNMTRTLEKVTYNNNIYINNDMAKTHCLFVGVYFIVIPSRMSCCSDCGKCVFRASAAVGAFFNFGDDFMLIAKSVIEKILEENQNEKYVHIDMDKLLKESYSDAVSSLATINAICISDLPDSEKVSEIYEQTKSRR